MCSHIRETKIHYYETFYAILKRVIASAGVEEEEDEDEREENAHRYDQKSLPSRPAPATYLHMPMPTEQEFARTRRWASMCS